MHLSSINIGRPEPLPDYDGPSGINKQPHSGPLAVTVDGLAEDTIIDTRHHGGPDQALYAYGGDDYAWWDEALGRTLPPGSFGENLTIGGLASAALYIGDRLRIGAVLVEVTAPRIPCRTLGAHMGDAQFPKAFRAAERPGVYLRVLDAGTLEAGVAVVLEPGERTVSILDIYRANYDPAVPDADLVRFLAAPIDARTRAKLEARRARRAGR